jgi:hypothetical protein
LLLSETGEREKERERGRMSREREGSVSLTLMMFTPNQHLSLSKRVEKEERGKATGSSRQQRKHCSKKMDGCCYSPERERDRKRVEREGRERERDCKRVEREGRERDTKKVEREGRGRERER